MKRDTTVIAEFDGPDDDEQRTTQRRLFTYSARAIAAAGAVDRVMVNYPAFADAMIGADRVFQLGRELSIPQGIMVTGASGSGKTAMARYFLSSQPKSTLFDEGFGALAIRLPSRPTVGHVVGTLLRRLRYPFPHVNSQSVDAKRQVLIDALRQKGTRMIFIDEAHCLLTQARSHARSSSAYGNVTDLLRELMDEAHVAIALLGTDELMELRTADSHLDSRISARVELIGLETPAIWQGFVRTFVKKTTPVDLSLLADKEEAARLLSTTEGNLRAFKRLVTEGVLVAIDDGSSSITVQHLFTAYERVSGKGAAKDNPYVV